MVQYRDFDEALANQEPVRFQMRGKKYELPMDVPAKAMLELFRVASEQGRGMEDPDVGVRFVGLVVGQENLDQMIEDGASITQLLQLAAWVDDIYGMKLKQATEVQEKAEEPVEGTEGVSQGNP